MTPRQERRAAESATKAAADDAHRRRYIARGLVRPAQVEGRDGPAPLYGREQSERSAATAARIAEEQSRDLPNPQSITAANRRSVAAVLVPEADRPIVRAAEPLVIPSALARAREHGLVSQSPDLTKIPPHQIRK